MQPDQWSGGTAELARLLAPITGTDVAPLAAEVALRDGAQRQVVVVTDGEADSIPAAARFADSWGMPIYAIGLCIGEQHPLRRHALSYRAADNFEDLAKGLTETLAELPSFDATSFEGE